MGTIEVRSNRLAVQEVTTRLPGRMDPGRTSTVPGRSPKVARLSRSSSAG